jgi:hypothetical protein
LEGGLVGMASGPAAALVVAGLCAFFMHVVWMRGRMRRPAIWLPRPDPGALQAIMSLLCGALAMVMGAVLMASPRAPRTQRGRAVYGVLGLIGFLAQIVVGVRTRVLPMFVALHVNRARGCDVAPITPAHMGSLRARWVVFLLWVAAVPLLATGMGLSSVFLVRTAAWLLVAATTLDGIEAVQTTATFTQWTGGSESNRQSHVSPPSRPIQTWPVVVPK